MSSDGGLQPNIIAYEQSVAQVFGAAFRLILPYFQRGYAWKQVHALRLLDDVLALVDGRRDLSWYPLGQIIVAKSPDAPDAYVADGHQRLITLTILIALLRDLEDDPARKRRLAACVSGLAAGGAIEYRLTTHEAERETLITYVQMDGVTADPFTASEDDATESEENVIANRDAMRSIVEDLPDPVRAKLVDTLLDRCLLLVTTVRELKVAQLLFSTMHDTGLKPTNVDLFKAQVLSRVNAPAREGCQTVWESLEARLGHSGFEALLRHVAELHTRQPLKEDVSLLLERHFDLQEASAAESFIDRTLRRRGATFLEVIEAPIRPVSFPPAICRRLQYLSWVRNHDTWVVPLLAWIDKNGADHKDTEAFLHRLEALAWALMISTSEPPQRHRRYMRVAAEIDDGKVMAPNGALAVTRQERTKITAALSQPNYMNRAYKLFLLLRANAAIEGDELIPPLPEATIEHIYPRNPASNSRWSQDFPSKDTAAQFRNSLGNLTLLTRAEQDRTKNHDFPAKRPILAASKFALSRRLAPKRSWTPDDIEASTREVIEILMRSWRLG